MKIAFVGDSYCADIGKETWPGIVAKESDAKIIAKGLGGRHLFHSYEILLEVVDEADYTVFCVSEPFRLPNRYSADIKKNSGASFLETEAPGGKKLMEKIQTAITYYYTHLISFDCHEVAQKGLLMQIDELMLQKKKKCIWFPCFNSSMCGFIPKSGPYASTILADVCAPYHEPAPFIDPKNQNRFTDASAGQTCAVIGISPFLNHFDKTGNRIIANLIIDIIERDAFDAYEIEMEQYFK